MIKAIAGTKDILPEDIKSWKHLELLVEQEMVLFNFKEIRTPIFEETALFSRGIGEATDIVSKEMYTFTDRSGTSVTLKPEMTASVVRAFIEHELNKKANFYKLFYISPMFRQERPQAGRLRQFHQFGAEAIGSNDPIVDAEIIIIAHNILKNLGLKNFEIKINSLGIPTSREKYKEELRKYLGSKLDSLSEDSRKRFKTNILRIFDSKNEVDQKIMAEAPTILDYLDDESREHFANVKQLLSESNIPFTVDHKLVRGLDYYTNTTFEIISKSVGAQSALCGGGRYNLLIEQLGGKPVPATGFAAGMERILLACENEKCLNPKDEKLDVYLVRLDKDKKDKVFAIANFLRQNGLVTELDYLLRSVKAQMREANRLNSNFVLMIGGDEFLRNAAVLKNMQTGEQEEISLDNLSYIAKRIERKK